METIEAVGCIHLHSTYSDGSGTVADLIEAAAQAGLDYLILTDHHSIRARQLGLEGWLGRTLLIVGHEAGHSKGHLLAIDTPRKIRVHSAEATHIVEKTLQAGGLSFLAHPDGHPKPNFGIKDSRWKTRADLGFTGLEVWSYMYDWISEVQWWNLPMKIARPLPALRGPSPETLTLWDRLGARRSIAGYGGVDAHAKPVVPGVKIFPYRDMFQSIRNHLILEHPFSGNNSEDKALVLQALRKGRCFIALDQPDDSTGFRFRASIGEKDLKMGDSCLIADDEAEFQGGCPKTACMILMRDGIPCFESEASQWSFKTQLPGVYRVEVWRRGRPWIFSNPIYIRGESVIDG